MPDLLPTALPADSRMTRPHDRLLRRLTSPPTALLIVAAAALVILALRGLDIGHLQTDVIILRAWAREVGVEGFSERYFQVNQRHLLVGPLYALAYRVFEEQDAPYHAIFIASRLLQGVFLGGIVWQLTRRRLPAISAGLALMFTFIRVPELYQQINWYIEPTLTLLLASSYAYLRALAGGRLRVGLYAVSLGLYAVSVLIYEAGLPWVAVNALLGIYARGELPPRRRVAYALRDALPALAGAVVLGLLILFVFEPWETLRPDVSTSLVGRLAASATTLLTYPLLYAWSLALAARDGYALPVLGLAAAVGLLTWAYARWTAGEDAAKPRANYGFLIALALTMFAASLLLGVSSGGISPTYVDRITFGRAAGIALFWVALAFAVAERLGGRETAAAVACAALLAGPGLGWLMIYQGYAQRAFGEIDRITDGVMALRGSVYGPAHFLIVTDRDWVGARFVDASDVIVHETQQRLWTLGADATLDILHTAAHEAEFATLPGTCDTVSGEYSAGVCLNETAVHGSRWAFGAMHPNADIIVVRYESAAGRFSIVPSVALTDLAGYNVTSAGPETVATNPERLAAPLPLEATVPATRP